MKTLLTRKSPEISFSPATRKRSQAEERLAGREIRAALFSLPWGTGSGPPGHGVRGNQSPGPWWEERPFAPAGVYDKCLIPKANTRNAVFPPPLTHKSQ